MRHALTIFAFILVASASASASAAVAPTLFQGVYFFRGVSPLQRLTIDILDTRMYDFEKRRADIEKQGGACVYAASNTLRCTTHKSADQVANESLQEAFEANQKAGFEFGEMNGSPSLVNDAESLTEWLIPQTVKWPANETTSYREMVLDRTLVKLAVIGEDGEIWLHGETGDSSRLHSLVTVVRNEGRWRWHQDLIETKFEK